MDENGACKCPADRMADVLKNVAQLVKNEEAGRDKTMSMKSWEELYNFLSPKK